MYVFTKDLGLVGAHAQNTRHVTSKLRYALDAPSRSHMSLIRGKNMWRIKSAMPDKRYAAIFRTHQEKYLLCVRTFSLLKKLLAGEEANPELFDLINNFLEFLEQTKEYEILPDGQPDEFDEFFGEKGKNELALEGLKNLEAILLLRILNLLGYVPVNELTVQFAQGSEWNSEIAAAMGSRRKEAIAIINESLRASHL